MGSSRAEAIGSGLAKVTRRGSECAAFCRDRDVPCPWCEYPMRNSPDGVCPECGWVLEVGIVATNSEQRRALVVMGAWPVAIAASVVLGSVAYSLGWKTPIVVEAWRGQAYGVVVLSLIAYGLLGLGALLLRRGRPFRRAHRWLRIGWVLLFLLCVLLVLVPMGVIV